MKIKLIIIDAFDGYYTKPKINYFFNKDHIESWKYSPEGANKKVATVF